MEEEMEKIRIITDSASDITVENEKNLDIRVLPFQIALGDKSYTSRIDFDNDGFYELMAQYDEIPKTSQITPFEFQELYLEEAKAGYTDIILVLINSHGSSTYGNSVMAKDKGRQISCQSKHQRFSQIVYTENRIRMKNQTAYKGCHHSTAIYNRIADN